jgi:polyisoprenoid-binding protein YceI
MKQRAFQRLLAVAILALVAGACNKAPKGDDAIITDKQTASEGAGQSFSVDTADSKIRFTGHGVGKNHPGIFKLNSGEVQVSNNQITGGKFTIDIKSIKS